ncbi:MAG: c-type cytochrome [Myxococcales bacterium]|nr:c-type cytochrome [Myxococcales bacterium]
MADGVFGPLGTPFPSASAEELATFERGRAVALRRFTPTNGLGPEFNLTFCAGCHEKPVLGGSASHYRDFLLVGDELVQDVVVPRGKNGVQRQFSLETGRAPSDALTDVSATRNPIPFFGAGLLAELPGSEILSRADPDDEDGDGVSGRANYDGIAVGRFGRKAQTARIEIFVRGPLFNHMGITSEPLSSTERESLPGVGPIEAAMPTSEVQGVGAVVAAQSVIVDEPTIDFDGVPDPEISSDDLFDLVSFTLLLAAPEPDEPTEQTKRGEQSFEDVGCAKCHTPSLAGPRGRIPLYSDLLLHDMGAELADDMPMGEATGAEFRTQPLWGIATVAPYLHDGRAATLDEAIRWHGGEAQPMSDAYGRLEDGQRTDLIAFLESLGGRAQRTDGLLPPGVPPPQPGEIGAPIPGLDEGELAAFERGRALFDRDFSYSEGVGPTFNGDACRSCHFDPVIGGAGPAGVDAMRQGVFIGDVFAAPIGGTGLPRHGVTAVRPESDPEANFFEPRQTPSTLGLGLLEHIRRETIESLADPDDLNQDGIAGRAHLLGDGRLGRFGWKANVPSIREFVRDALTNELGMTVPAEPGFTFGGAEDEDEVIDPELDADTIDDIATFIASLAPPPRTRTDIELEDVGELVFEAAACGSCHVPSLETADGVEVRAYTDLLLHDVAAADALGIEEGAAGVRDFRTPPLWGLRSTAPYMHDGRASTIEEAIAAHEGEADESRMAVEALDRDQRAALLAFLRSL